MFIDKFKMEDGCYLDQDGNIYDDAEEFILINIFEFCGCGMPEKTLEYIRKALQTIKDLNELVWENKLPYGQWAKDKNKVFGDRGAEYFMWYVLDSKGLTDHGGSVPGWLTDKGKQLLSDLIELGELED